MANINDTQYQYGGEGGDPPGRYTQNGSNYYWTAQPSGGAPGSGVGPPGGSSPTTPPATTPPWEGPILPGASANSGLMKLLQALMLAGGGIGGNLLANQAGQGAGSDQLKSLLGMGIQRAQYQNPLFQAMTNGAYQMLPTFAKAGTQPPGGGT